MVGEAHVELLDGAEGEVGADEGVVVLGEEGLPDGVGIGGGAKLCRDKRQPRGVGRGGVRDDLHETLKGQGG